jgi:hypothetical protein
MPNPRGPGALPRMNAYARECLERAAYCRELAEAESDPELREYLHKLAAYWTRAAEEELWHA